MKIESCAHGGTTTDLNIGLIRYSIGIPFVVRMCVCVCVYDHIVVSSSYAAAAAA